MLYINNNNIAAYAVVESYVWLNRIDEIRESRKIISKKWWEWYQRPLRLRLKYIYDMIISDVGTKVIITLVGATYDDIPTLYTLILINLFI